MGTKEDDIWGSCLKVPPYEIRGGIRVAQRVQLVFFQSRVPICQENDAVQERVEDKGKYGCGLLRVRNFHGILAILSG